MKKRTMAMMPFKCNKYKKNPDSFCNLADKYGQTRMMILLQEKLPEINPGAAVIKIGDGARHYRWPNRH